ncbi:MAG: YbaB/EbfC family nucleoid-associated protein [Candidatus Aureabacteria bacterium]|nr:YbaB/EbfC family nucleoid-associated protein [Candidatus Auribacterota bacterium]
MAGFGNLLKQAQEMQKKLVEVKEKLEQARVEGTSGGGMVKAVVNGKKELLSLQINPEVVNQADVRLLEDLIVAAVRQANEKTEAITAGEMAALTGGISIPGLGI